jgi:phosphomannomutase
VVKKEDYLHGLYNMPGQDLMKFYFEDGSWFAIRPSGTEPKLKIYFIAVAKTYQEAKAKADLMEKNLLKDLHIDFKK